MKYLKISSLLLVFFAICSCNKNVTTKIIEEHDPVVKILEERDSLRIITDDSLKMMPLPKK